MRLSELAQKELIQVEEGMRYGFLAETDLLFDRKTGAIIGFEIRKKLGKTLFRQKDQNIIEYIPWHEIVLVGEDRILFGKTHELNKKEVEGYD
ncbi:MULTISPECIES: YlmC/YmxH family sporulation protein [Sporosarcina]|uniref:YlmC/YmxH family sporulation protein n=1 Tax=Sporosarcina TaxID=1569 RepID=UPI000A17BB8C|nr:MULTISPECIES: YlmC/YmxH family sporulation protein [Sporosarcina]ARK22759.1 sporulation protein, YlmC/YmxH family [Sporosarcina ureae]PIC75254.1 YlmC/YmxH family sporulation protein [Sporosarcina sp. P17b]